MNGKWQWWIKTFGVFILAGIITLLVNYGVAKERDSNFGTKIGQLNEKLETFNTLVYRIETAEDIIDNHDDDIKELNNILIKSITELTANQKTIIKQLDRLEK